MAWHRWIRYLAVALDMEELEDFRAYVYAGGNPKKFKWSSPDKAGTEAIGGSREALNETIKQFASKLSGGQFRKSDVWQYAKATGKGQQVFKAKKWEQQDDGKWVVIGEVYVNEKGEEVDPAGYVYVPSQNEEAIEAAKRFFGAGSQN